MQMVCEVYRCSCKQGVYLFIDQQTAVVDLPPALQASLGSTELAMTLLLTPDKKLARADAQQVMEAIKDQGFYLQMPPAAVDGSQSFGEYTP